jgi:hypothetical protein
MAFVLPPVLGFQNLSLRLETTVAFLSSLSPNTIAMLSTFAALEISSNALKLLKSVSRRDKGGFCVLLFSEREAKYPLKLYGSLVVEAFWPRRVMRPSAAPIEYRNLNLIM